MKHHRVFSILVFVAALLLGQASVFGAGGTIDVPTAFVVDPCREYEAVGADDWNQTSELRMMDLSDSPPLEIAHNYSTDFFSGVAFTTVPGPDYEQKYIFATRGSKLVVYDVGLKYSFLGSIHNTRLVREIDLAVELTLPGLELGRIAAGKWYGIEVQPGAMMLQAALYIVGTRPDNGEAFYFVIDQESLFLEDPVVTVYGQGQLCSWGNCTVSSVLDIRVGNLPVPNDEYIEEAYITAVQPFSESEDVQLTYRLERGLGGSAFSSEVVHASYFESPHVNPLVRVASGLRFAPDSRDAYVSRKDTWRIDNLVSGVASCALPAEPTDVAVWQPASSGVRYLLVTTWDGLTGRLYVTPADGCVDPQNPVVFDVVLGNRPTSLDLLTGDGDEATVVVVGEGDGAVDEEFQSIHLTYTGATDPFDAWIEGMSLETELWTGEELDSCPSYVHLGLRKLAYKVIPCGDPGDGCTGIDRGCLPGDLRCPNY